MDFEEKCFLGMKQLKNFDHETFRNWTLDL